VTQTSAKTGTGSTASKTADPAVPGYKLPIPPAPAPSYGPAPPERSREIRNDRPLVVVKTSAGEFKLQLHQDLVPQTVDQFLAAVDRKKYDGTVFHQVIDGYLVLGGGPGSASQPSERDLPYRNEAHRGMRNLRGTIALSRDPSVIDSGQGEFFINLADNADLDHVSREPQGYGYCVFGEIIGGQDVVERIARTPVRDRETYQPMQPVVIESIRRFH